ncbi:MAG: hypothetical protein P4L51_01455 [Puia sp.]|nr:hypothetical protein [Puia sp.]
MRLSINTVLILYLLPATSVFAHAQSSFQNPSPHTPQVTPPVNAQRNPRNRPDTVGRIDYYRQIRYLHKAAFILPGLLKDGQTRQVRNFLENWKRSETPSDELIFSIGALLDMENGTWSMLNLPCDAFYFLDDYARELKEATDGTSGFRYSIVVSATYSYDATPEARQLLVFIRSWALRLLASRQLDAEETFLCHVFAGDILRPRHTLRHDKDSYPGFVDFRRRLDRYDDDYFAYRHPRHDKELTTGIMAGIWLPTGHLQTLGAHPSLSLLIGGRNKKNEYDLVWSFRFLYPTPHPYMVLRNDTLHTSSYYDGGYIGFDYTRYLVRRTHFEWGIISAIGYDYFSVASGWGSDSSPVPLPLNVGSFDFSNGIRCKYFFHRRSFFGLAAKYHLINYCNTGGTDLAGHAFTIDLVYGAH